MIFVTVGTHEQQFDRLVRKIDDLKGSGALGQEKVIIQTGYSGYEPKNCTWSAFFPYEKMISLVGEARIVITHGGPSSFVMPLQVGKIPVVVPRQFQYTEHVNDHQLTFCKAVEKRMCNILVVEDIGALGDLIERYDEIVGAMPNEMKSNNALFCERFEGIVDQLLGKK